MNGMGTDTQARGGTGTETTGTVMEDYEGYFFRGFSTLHMAAAKVLIDP